MAGAWDNWAYSIEVRKQSEMNAGAQLASPSPWDGTATIHTQGGSSYLN